MHLQIYLNEGNTLNIIVCDDEKIFREQVRTQVEQFFGKLDCNCLEYSDGTAVIEAFQNGIPMDVVFLDIEMPKLEGIATAKQLRTLGCEALILFLTNHIEMAMDGYEVAAFRFLAKPIVKEKLDKALADLKEELLEKKKMVIHFDGEDVVIVLDDIVYIEAMNNYISIVLEQGEYTIRKKLSNMENELSELTDKFFRIHRGYLVNLAHVKKYHGKEVVLTGDVTLPISRGSLNEFKERLFAYVRSSAV